MKELKDDILAMITGKMGVSGMIGGWFILLLMCIPFFLFVYAMTEYTEYVLGILLLGIFVLFCRISDRLDKPEPKPVCCPLYESIRHCLYTAILTTEDHSGLLTPVTERALDTIQHPLSSDNIHRFEFRVRRNPRHTTKPDAAFIKYLLNEELNLIFSQNTYIFSGLCSQINGLYVQTVRECTSGFVIVIVPVCRKTAAFVSMHNEKELVKDITQVQPEKPADDQF